MSDAYIASEWAYNPVVYGKNPVFILVSQSGETGDILACKFYKTDTVIAITNNKDSSINKRATFSIDLECGEEVGIAATKSFSTQYVALFLLAAAISDNFMAITQVKRLITSIPEVFKIEDKISEVSNILVPRNRAFILGRGLDYISATEGSLKIKETSYMFAEPYASGEFKHGYIALVEFGVPTIGLVSSSATSKLFRSNMNDVRSKGGQLIIISSEKVSEEGDQLVTPFVNQLVDPLLQIICLQLLACYVSYKKGLDTDSPRSLVKSVHGE